jgi:hypothetical protein
MATSQVTKVVTNVRMSSFELSVFLNYFNQTLNCSTDFGKTGNIKFHENPSTLNLVVLYRTAGHAGRLKKKTRRKVQSLFATLRQHLKGQIFVGSISRTL